MLDLLDEAEILAHLGIDAELLELATVEELGALYEALEELTAESHEWQLQERQQVAEDLTRDADVFELLYGGAAGGGKSDWILWHFYNLAKTFPGFHGLIIRRKFPELRRSLILRSWARFDRSIARYNVSQHTWYFDNGSIIEFGYCEQDQDVYQYQSAEYDCIAVDELTQFATDFVWTYLASRCRTTMAKALMGLRPHMIAGTNPGNVGALWVKMRWVDPAPWGEVFEERLELDGEEPRVIRRVFVPAKLSDNRYINRQQYRIALANLGDKLRQQLEDGSWDVVEGQYFEEWDRDRHVVAPFKIPPEWFRFTGYDFGHRNPACHLWFALGPDGLVVCYRELYKRGLTIVEQASAILDAEQEGKDRPTYRVADPSIWTRTGAGPPIADQFRDQGVVFRKANNARIDGWLRVREYLRVDEQTGRPGIVFFHTLHNFLRTFPMLVHDDVKPEDLDTDGEDHAADALRYALMSRPVTPRRAEVGRRDPEVNEAGQRIARPDLTLKRKKAAERRKGWARLR